MAEPITTAELKSHLRISHDTQDTYLGTLIAAAREQVERDTWRGLVAASKTLALPAFPEGDSIALLWTPLRSVTSITYLNPAGTPVVLDAGQYVVDVLSEPGVIHLAANCSWPETKEHPNAVVIVFAAGYADAASVPPMLKHAVKLIAAELWNSDAPEPLSAAGGGTGGMRTTLDRILEQYRVRADALLIR